MALQSLSFRSGGLRSRSRSPFFSLSDFARRSERRSERAHEKSATNKMKQKESKLMEQKIKIINRLFFKVDQPRWALFSSISLSWPCSWCMVVNIFF
jgi:hypothetical protein